MYFLSPLALLTASKAARRTSSNFFLLIIPLLLLLASLSLVTSSAKSARDLKIREEKDLTQKERSEITRAYGKLPLSFEANLGQTDERVRFIARGVNYGLFLTANEAVLALRSAPSESERNTTRSDQPYDVLRMRLLGAKLKPQISGLDQLPGKTNYFIGNDRKKWRKGTSLMRKWLRRLLFPLNTRNGSVDRVILIKLGGLALTTVSASS